MFESRHPLPPFHSSWGSLLLFTLKRMFKTFIAASVAAASFAVPAMAQVTSVSQLKDVQPTDWSYQAISNLISRYGCVAGFPNGTFQPGQPATRGQLAALVNACIDRIAEYQSAEDARTAAALKQQAAQWQGTQAAVTQLQLAAAQKAQGVGNYLGAGVYLNRAGVAGNGYGVDRTVYGVNLQGRYALKTYSNQNAVSVRPYVNFAAGPNGQIGAGGGALATYDVSLAKGASGVSKTNLYLGAGYQIPFVNNTDSNFQSAVGDRGQVVFAGGIETRLSNSVVGYGQITFPTVNSGAGSAYSPVLSGGLGVKF